MKIGIVGCGFVGSAVKSNLERLFEVRVYDIDESKRHPEINSTAELAKWADVIFVSVPTLSIRTYTSLYYPCDTSIVEEVVEEAVKSNPECLIVIKSTIPPGTTDRLFLNYSGKLVFNPEFLTEKNAEKDFREHSPIIIGSRFDDEAEIVESIYRKMIEADGSNIEIVHLGRKEAEMIKYAANCFLATKVIFANQIHELCSKLQIDYNKVKECLIKDERLGKTHWSVPGPDGHLGFGGSCFPKDTMALAAFARNNDMVFSLLEKVVQINFLLRDDLEETALDYNKMFDNIDYV